MKPPLRLRAVIEDPYLKNDLKMVGGLVADLMDTMLAKLIRQGKPETQAFEICGATALTIAAALARAAGVTYAELSDGLESAWEKVELEGPLPALRRN